VQGGLSLAPSQYPAAVRNDSLKEVRFGQTVADPYRWLETNSSATRACAAAGLGLRGGAGARCCGALGRSAGLAAVCSACGVV